MTVSLSASAGRVKGIPLRDQSQRKVTQHMGAIVKRSLAMVARAHGRAIAKAFGLAAATRRRRRRRS